MRTANQVTVTLNETLLQTISAQNNKIDILFHMVETQAYYPLPINNQNIVPNPAHQEREKNQFSNCKRMCFHKLKNFPETNADKRWPGWK